MLFNLEVMRRLALVVGLFVSIMMFTTTISGFYVVYEPDFNELRQARVREVAMRVRALENDLARMAKVPNAKNAWQERQEALIARLKEKKAAIKSQPLDQFVADLTKGKTVAVSGPQWDSVMEQLGQYARGRTPEQWLDYASAKGNGPKKLYFPSGEEPFAGVAEAEGTDLYLLYDDKGETRYWRLSAISPRTAEDYVKSSTMHPWRAYFYVPFVVGLLLYLFIIPKVKRPEGALGYPGLWGVMVSDFFSLVISGLLFLFGFLLIMFNNATILTLSAMETGPLAGVFVIWLIAVLCLAGMLPGIGRRNFWIKLLPQGLERHSFGGTVFYNYADMKLAGLHVRSFGWVANLIILLGAFNNGGNVAMGQSMKGKTEASILIEMNDGGRLPIRIESIGDGEPLARALRNNNVPLDPDLAKALEG